jgi:predicted AAA+ superfamily ATPase
MVYIDRLITSDIIKSIRNFPVTAVIGPRQCGKSTLAKHILKEIPNS